VNLEEMLLRERDRPAANPLAARAGEIIARVRRRRRARAAVGGVASAATVAAVAVVAWQILAPGQLQGPATTSPSTTTTSQSAPSETPSSPEPPIDTAAWTTFSSDRYGFSIGHPTDWTVMPADHDWTLAADADQWPSTGFESFFSPTEDVLVSAWSVPVDPGTTIEAWVEQYCQQTGTAADIRPCTEIGDRAVPLCNEWRDCHPGLLVPFATDVQAFFTGGDYQDVMVVVAVWRPETHSSVEQYGGSRRLLEAFLSTMDVVPSSP